MTQWLVLGVGLLALAVGVFALLRANRVDAAMRQALASLPGPAALPGPSALPGRSGGPGTAGSGGPGTAAPAPAAPAPAAPAPAAAAPAPAPAALSVTLPDVQGALSRVAVVRFDAFADISGKLSSTAALLDEHGNGLVITTMNGRDSSRSYLKGVRRGIGLVALSPEESDAVSRALGTTKRVP